MRPFVSFFTFVSFFLAAALVAARTETINSPDRRILFDGPWQDIEFPGGAFSYIRRDDGKATLTVFNASQISVTVMVEIPGDMVRISLDDVDYDVFPKTSQVPAWNSSILNPSVPHTIKVIKKNPNTRYTSLYSFLVTHPGSPEDTPDTTPSVPIQSATVPDEAGTSSTPKPSSSSALSAQQSNTEPVLSGAKLAGVIVGCIAALALIIIGIFLYRRWMIGKRKAASTAYWDYMTTRAQQPSGPPFPPTSPHEKFDGAETKELP